MYIPVCVYVCVICVMYSKTRNILTTIMVIIIICIRSPQLMGPSLYFVVPVKLARSQLIYRVEF